MKKEKPHGLLIMKTTNIMMKNKINLLEQSTTYNWANVTVGNGDPNNGDPNQLWDGPKTENRHIREIGGEENKPNYELYENSAISNSPLNKYVKPIDPTSTPPGGGSGGGGGGGSRTIEFPNPFGGDPIKISLPGPYRENWDLRSTSSNPDVQRVLDQAKRDADSYTEDNLRVWFNDDDNTEQVVLAGRDVTEKPHLYIVSLDPDGSGKMGWINDLASPPKWKRFEDY